MNKLKELRLGLKKSQAEIATILGITSQAYGKYENEHRQPDPEMLKKLADYFNVSIDYLLGREEQPALPPQLNDVQIAFFDGIKDLEPQDLDEVAKFVDFIKSKK